MLVDETRAGLYQVEVVSKSLGPRDGHQHLVMVEKQLAAIMDSLQVMAGNVKTWCWAIFVQM